MAGPFGAGVDTEKGDVGAEMRVDGEAGARDVGAEFRTYDVGWVASGYSSFGFGACAVCLR